MAVLSNVSKLILLLSSFSPLLIVFGLLDYWGPGWPTFVCYTLAVLSWLGLSALAKQARRLASTPLQIVKSDRKDQEILTYLAANLLPFLSISPDNTREIIASAVFVGLIALFVVRGEIYYTNPALAIANYRIIAVETKTQVVYVITKRTFFQSGSEIRAITLSNHIMWESNQ